MNPQLLLSLTLYYLNFLNLTKNNSDTRADRHFAEDKNSKLEINAPIWYKQFFLQLLGKGYGLVIEDGEKIWVPLHHVRYQEGPQDRTPSGSDEVDAKGLVNDPGGANEETPSSESLPNMGSSENMTRQAEQTLKSTGTPMTPDKLFLAM